MNNSFFIFSQTGMYLDFIIKQILEYFVRNVLIYTSLFFGEKYIIEYLTKKTIDSFVFNSNKIFSFTDLTFHNFFFIITSFIFYLLSFIFIIFILI